MSSNQESGSGPPRRWVGRLTLAGAVLLGAVGAACGYAGICTTEYKASPRDEAILVAIGWGVPYGTAIGLAFGLIADWARRRR